MWIIRDKRLWCLVGSMLVLAVGVAAYQISQHHSANQALEDARAALDRYEYEEAWGHLQRYLAIRPRDSAGLLLASRTARRRGYLNEAYRQLRLAEEQGALADAIGTEARLLDIQDGSPTFARDLATYCHENPTDPDTPNILEAIVVGSLKAEQIGYAMWAAEWFLKHQARDIDQAHGLVMRGRVFSRGREHDKALADFRRAVELAPDYASARYWLATVPIDNFDGEAMTHIDWLRRKRSSNPQVKYQAARLYRNLARWDESARLLDEALSVSPDNINYLVERGRVALDANRPAEAEPLLRRAHELATNERDVNISLAECLRLLGRMDESRKHTDKARDIDAALKKKLENPELPRIPK